MSDHDFRVKRFSPEHLSDIQALWRQMYSEDEIEDRTRIFEWFALGNPSVTEESPPYYLLLDGDRVVGMHGQAPWPYSIAGQRVRAYVAYDDMLSVDYRGKGLGKIMLDGVADMRPEITAGLWHNDPNERLYGKAGWLGFSDFRPYYKIFDPGPLLRSRFGNTLGALLAPFGRVAVAVLEAFRRKPPTTAYSFEVIDRFGPEFDDFFDSVEKSFDAIAVRDASYLNWKFVDKPFTPFDRVAARDEDGKLAGYVVFRRRQGVEEVNGSIVDVLADPRSDAFTALIGYAVEELRGAGAQNIHIACTHPAFVDRLGRLGFIRSRHKLRFMINHWQGTIDPAWTGSVRHWYLTYSDGDGDCWTTE